MDLLYTFTDIRYWPTVLCTTALTLFYDHQVKVLDLERARVDKRVFWPQYFRKIEYVCLIGFRLT